MDQSPAIFGSRGDRAVAWMGALGTLACIVWMATWTGDAGSAIRPTVFVLIGSLPHVLAWLAAAIGFGWPLRLVLARQAQSPLALQTGLGMAALLVLDAGLGALGALQLGGSVGAWGVLVVGWALLIWCAWRDDAFTIKGSSLSPWAIWIAAPALAAGVLAACSAPGWLWASEFGGYDALSYHLQLPKEWLALGRIQPLEHNVYSAFPSYMEAAYYHLAVLRGSAIEASYDCQLLHFAFGIVAALLAGNLAARITNTLGGVVTTVVVLATPWTIVAGTLAYNESAVVLLLVAGLVVIDEDEVDSLRRGAMLGLIMAAACGAKLTAVGYVALPLGILALASARMRHWPMLIASIVLVGAVAALPYVLRNAVHLGQPVFPFLSGVLGTAHWSIEQAAIWNVAHSSDAAVSERLTALWNQWMRYGIGANPDPNEPWMAQWSIVPWLGVFGLIAGLFIRRGHSHRWSLRLLTVLVIQLLFWLGFTHLQSRFLLPTVAPLGLGAAFLVHALLQARDRRAASTRSHRIFAATVCVILLALSIVPVAIFADQRSDAPTAMIGSHGLFTGAALNARQREQFAQKSSPIVYVNHVLPETAKTLLVGDATPFYYMADVTYATTWDRGPLSRAMDEHPDQPQQWVSYLRSRGFTHVLIQPNMIVRWQRSGWNDPQITNANMNRLVEHLRLAHRWPQSGIALYELP